MVARGELWRRLFTFYWTGGTCLQGWSYPATQFQQISHIYCPSYFGLCFLVQKITFSGDFKFCEILPCICVQEDAQRDPNINQYSILKESISRREGESPILANLRPADPQLIPEILARQPTLLILVPSSNRMGKVMMKNITYPQFFLHSQWKPRKM